MTTAILVDGYGHSGYLPLMLRGETVAGCQQVTVRYDNTGPRAGSEEAMSEGIDRLNELILSTSGPKRVVGVSAGAAIICGWQQIYGPTCPVPPEELECLLLANPERRHTGAAVLDAKMMGVPITKRYSRYAQHGVGLPDEIRYPTTDFGRQYDGVCDWPNGANPNWEAQVNAFLGTVSLHMFGYFDRSLGDSGNVVTRPAENLTHILAPTRPTLVSGGWSSPEWLMRPRIESAYRRD